MTMSAASTSLQRTYRYVRLSLVGIVVMLAAAIAVQWINSGPLGSVSAAYYTAAGPIFVGGVFAVALALLVLSGRSFGQVSLDLAAIVAPLIAVVPAPVFAGDVPGLTLTCPSGVEPCVPEAFVPAVATGMTALLVTAAVGWGSVFVLAVVQGAVSRRLLTLVVSGVLIAATTVWWFAASDSFLRVGHVIAAASFFAFIALAALASGIDAGRARAFGYRAVYLTIAIAIVTILLVLLAVVIAGSLGAAVPEPWGISPVFLGEAAALVLFAAFWVAQTIETWNDPDPTFRSGAAGNRLSAPR